MGAARKVITVVVVAALCMYFMTGLLGILPYEYDIIKRGTLGVETQANTGVVTDIEDWKSRFDFPLNEGRVVDSIAWKNNLYFLCLGEAFPYQLNNYINVYRLDYNGTLHSVSGVGDFPIDYNTQFSFAKFILYEDNNSVEVLYLVTSGYSSQYGGTDFTRYRASYDGLSFGGINGERWLDPSTFIWIGNDDIIPMLFEETTAVKKTTSPVRFNYGTYRTPITSGYVWQGYWTTSGWKIENKLALGSSYRVTSIEQYQYDLGSPWVMMASISNGIETYVYYYDGTVPMIPKLRLKDYTPSDETRIKSLYVYNNILYMGTSKGRIWTYDASINWITMAFDSGTEGILSFGTYKNRIYAGGDWEVSLKSAQGKIYVDDGTGWKRDGGIAAHTIYSFTEFTENGIHKFFATSGDLGEVFEYSETLIYGNPIIDHTPVTEGYVATPTVIRCQVRDSDGVLEREVKLYYQVSGEIPRIKNMTRVSGDKFAAEYETTIPEQSRVTTIDYYIEAVDVDTNMTSTSTYTIDIKEYPTIFGLDYRILYVIAIILTLIIGYFAYGRNEKTENWRRK